MRLSAALSIALSTFEGSSLKRKVMSSLSTASNMKLTRRIVLPKRCSSR